MARKAKAQRETERSLCFLVIFAILLMLEGSMS